MAMGQTTPKPSWLGRHLGVTTTTGSIPKAPRFTTRRQIVSDLAWTLRGEGGQVNATSDHSGRTGYRWATERGPYDAVVSEAPAWLLDLVMDQTPPIAAPPKPSLRLIAEANKHLTDAPSYVTRYNEEHSWDEILLRDGWTLSHADREGCALLDQTG